MPLHSYTCAAARAVGGCEEIVYPGAGHVPTAYAADWTQRAVNFLCRTALSGICQTDAPLPLQISGVN